MPVAGFARSSRWRGRWRHSTAGSTAASVFRAALAPQIPVVEADGARLKFNPFANVSRERDRGDLCGVPKLPPHPLVAIGLPVGRLHALHQPRPSPDEDARAGRWRGRAKTECGIHTRQDFLGPKLPGTMPGPARPTRGNCRPRSPFSHGWYATTAPSIWGRFHDARRRRDYRAFGAGRLRGGNA